MMMQEQLHEDFTAQRALTKQAHNHTPLHRICVYNNRVTCIIMPMTAFERAHR